MRRLDLTPALASWVVALILAPAVAEVATCSVLSAGYATLAAALADGFESGDLTHWPGRRP
jgi:hypothetical protein